MNRVPLGVVGDGPRLAELPSLRGVFEIEAWSPDDANRSRGGPTSTTGLRQASRWQDVVSSDQVSAVVVLPDVHNRFEVTQAALGEGKDVLSVGPLATSRDQLARLAKFTDRVVLAESELFSAEAGQRAAASLSADELGPLNSLYIASRAPATSDPLALRALRWEVLDFLGRALPDRIERIYATSGALFTAGPDTLVAIARTERGTMVTIEISQCLADPRLHPFGRDVELEAIAHLQSLRATPLRPGVSVSGERGTASLPLLEDPLLDALDRFAAAVDRGPETGWTAREHLVVSIEEAIATSISTGKAVQIRA